MKRYILTGTPGCGKTSLILGLERKGYFIIPEAATDVIAYEQSLNMQEPWNYPNFIDKIVDLQKQRQQQVKNTQTSVQFYDRSPFCTEALAKYLKFEPSKMLMAEIDRVEKNHIYEKKTFFIQNLGFCNPTEARKISYEESLRFESLHLDTYKEWGYECIMIPPSPLPERIDTLLDLFKNLP